MADEPQQAIDLGAGVEAVKIAEGGMLAGRVGEEAAILLRSGGTLYAVGAQCTHYSGPLAQGLLVEDSTLRCPWHHACFDVRSGEALRAPALDPIACWRVEQVGETAYVREKLPASAPRVITIGAAGVPDSIVIVGGGAAGLAAAEMLRREGYRQPVTMVSADESAPCDRPNLSKDYLAGSASEDWIPLRPPAFYADHQIDLKLATRVASIDVAGRRLQLEGGGQIGYGALLLATGADPLHVDVPGAEASQLHYLRSFGDSQAIIAKAASARHAVVVGTSFIGLEVAAALRTRGLEVHVVGRDSVPMEKVLGADVGRFVQKLHESHGVVFHFDTTLSRIDGNKAVLGDGTKLQADLIVIGAGVRPAIALAEQAGLATDRGVLVDEYLQTSVPGIYAAGDIARWPDARSGQRIRVEHWVVAERQGQVAALNLLGRRRRFDAVPFFWSQHYDVSINYVGHAESWDEIGIDGSLDANDCTVSYRRGGEALAVATIFRDLENLQAERAMELAAAKAGS